MFQIQVDIAETAALFAGAPWIGNAAPCARLWFPESLAIVLDQPTSLPELHISLDRSQLLQLLSKDHRFHKRVKNWPLRAHRLIIRHSGTTIKSLLWKRRSHLAWQHS